MPQDQVLQIAQAMAGYSLGEADLLRRAMGKKKPEEMAKQRAGFMEGCAANGIDKELAFPNAVLALFHYPDKSMRERVFRIYNEHIADLQERSDGHFYGVGLINWWDPKGTRSTLEELKALGLKTFLLPLNPGKDDDGNIYVGRDEAEVRAEHERQRLST